MDYRNVKLELNAWNACRTNTGMAQTNGYHYDLEKLISVSTRDGYNGQPLVSLARNLDYCAKNGNSELAIKAIKDFAEALLSAYQIQESSYKEHPEK